MPSGLSDEELAQQYGMTLGFLNAYPELKNLFDQAVREDWTADKFQAKFRNSDWYKSKSDQGRKTAIMMYTDPATYNRLWQTTYTHIRTMMGDMGSNADDWNVVNAIATKVIFEGWNDEEARNYIGQHVTFGSGGMAGGKAGQTQQNLNSYMYAMGVKNSDQWIQDATRRVASGMASEQDFKNQIMSQAIAAFPQYEKQLRAGNTLQDLAQPYTQSMSQILEIPPGSVNMFDPTIRRAMSFKDKNTGVTSAMPLWDFQNQLRQDDRWKQTQNAQDAAMGTAHKVLQDMGMAY